MLECLERLGEQCNPVNPATCASGESNIGNMPQTDPRQVVSPNSNQTLQDPPQLDAYLRPEELSRKRKEEETPTLAPKREEFDVKEEPESPGLREGDITQASQPSELPQERSVDPGTEAYSQDASGGPSDASWIVVMNELRSVQFACEQLRTRMDSAEIGTDMSEDLSRRISRFEETVNLNQANESFRRIIRLEESAGHGHVRESLREYQLKVNQRSANIESLTNRLQTRAWLVLKNSYVT